MGKFWPERRARFVMFLGLALLALLFIFDDRFDRWLGYGALWIYEDGWMHALGAALALLGAWKWLNAQEEARDQTRLDQGEEARRD